MSEPQKPQNSPYLNILETGTYEGIDIEKGIISTEQEEKDMTDPQIAKKSPYLVMLEAGTYYWCSCGRSKKQPFCDGSHEGTEFTPVEFQLPQREMVYLCGCKRTKHPPFCDSSHISL